jgi:hypothetical protein
MSITRSLPATTRMSCSTRMTEWPASASVTGAGPLRSLSAMAPLRRLRPGTARICATFSSRSAMTSIGRGACFSRGTSVRVQHPVFRRHPLVSTASSVSHEVQGLVPRQRWRDAAVRRGACTGREVSTGDVMAALHELKPTPESAMVSCPKCQEPLVRAPANAATGDANAAWRCLRCGWLGDDEDRRSEGQG